MKSKYICLLLLFGSLFGCGTSKEELTINVKNPSSFDRNNEIVGIAWDEVQQKLSLTTDQSIVVTDNTGGQISYQLATNGSDSIESLIFLVSLEAGQESAYSVSVGKPELFQSLVYGRLVPERKDDFAWENNRTAFRVYGPALKATGQISNGMDFWAKKTDS